MQLSCNPYHVHSDLAESLEVILNSQTGVSRSILQFQVPALVHHFVHFVFAANSSRMKSNFPQGRSLV